MHLGAISGVKKQQFHVIIVRKKYSNIGDYGITFQEHNGAEQDAKQTIVMRGIHWRQGKITPPLFECLSVNT